MQEAERVSRARPSVPPGLAALRAMLLPSMVRTASAMDGAGANKAGTVKLDNPFDCTQGFLKPGTSPAVSPTLARVLASQRRVHPGTDAPDSSKLSARDSDGLQWNGENRVFLKVDNAYPKIAEQNGNRYVITGPCKQRMHVRLTDGQFHVETARERLKNIFVVGSSGRKRARGEDVLMDCGYTLESANALLSTYAFPARGFYTAYEFSLHIEAWEVLPRWAKRFKIAPQGGSSVAGAAVVSESADTPSAIHAFLTTPADSRINPAVRRDPLAFSTDIDEALPGPSQRPDGSLEGSVPEQEIEDAVPLSDTSFDELIEVWDASKPGHRMSLRLGSKLGDGHWGTVYKDAEDPAFVIKRYFQLDDDDEAIDEIYTARCEGEAFRRLYGDDSAQHLKEEDGTQYLRMYRIPGVPLHVLTENSLPIDAVERYVDMLEKLRRQGIMHGDLHSENILWDGEFFWPIDMQDISANYFAANNESKAEYNQMGEDDWQDVYTEIVAKMPSAGKP
ncbi:serine/threonine-protein kinase [Robbsia betulipollinis]|uniref:serine/threonine-protein kinase n=1 Tax=Robbsia betulipollinis TaxID=2981849 RepID=UPI00226E2274|nr:serine/threonine-protein kinase [Robbsia betulipollinis]